MSLLPSATFISPNESFYASVGGGGGGGTITADSFVANGASPAPSGFVVDSASSVNFVAMAQGGTLVRDAFTIANLANVNRWSMGVKNAEGAGVGSDLTFDVYNDVGGLVGTVLSCERGAGNLVSTNGSDGLTVGNTGSLNVPTGAITSSGNITSSAGNIVSSAGSVSGATLVANSASITTASMTVGTYAVLSSTPTTIAMTVNASKPVFPIVFTDGANFFFDQSYPASFNTMIIYDDVNTSPQIGFIVSNSAINRAQPLGTMLTIKWTTFPTAVSSLEVQCIGQSTPAISLFTMTSATPQSVFTCVKVRDNGDSDDWVRMSYV
jgi:hypothetical protein